MEAARSDSHSRANYEILRIVNRGGMGEIALAKVIGKNGFEKLVVLKRLREDAEREDHRAMFDIEAELMSRIPISFKYLTNRLLITSLTLQWPTSAAGTSTS